MSIRPTEINNQMYESRATDMTESEIKKEDLKKKYLFLLLFIVIDYLITILVIFQESNVFKEAENNYLFLSINSIGFTLFELFILISLALFRVYLSKVIKYLYIVIIFIYFFFLLIKKFVFCQLFR